MITKKEIASKAFNMFRHWSAVAKHIYTKHNFAIIDETKLVNDLTNAIEKAHKALHDKEKYPSDERHIVRWGFVCLPLRGTKLQIYGTETKKTDRSAYAFISRAV